MRFYDIQDGRCPPSSEIENGHISTTLEIQDGGWPQSSKIAKSYQQLFD